MALTNVTVTEEAVRGRVAPDANPGLARTSAVSWGAIIAGAAAAAALSLIMLILGVGLGLSSISPWAQSGVSAGTFGISTIIWISLTQLLASGLGGYLAGRLRTKWTAVQADEVYFRDTAHGFLAWAVATLATATLLTSVIGAIIGGGVQAGASMAGGAVNTGAVVAGGAAAGGGTDRGDTIKGSVDYFVDSLFRGDSRNPSSTGNAVRSAAGSAPAANSEAASLEMTRIFMNSLRTENLPPEDVRYIGQVVAQRTGLSQQEAEKRVNEVYARLQEKLRAAESTAKELADKSRKASAYAALWLFISLLIGAFVASLAATYGGRRRDA